MPGISRIGDTGTGHASFPPTTLIAGSGNVIVNGIPASRVGDALAPHGSPSPSPPHPRKVSQGASTVLTNGKPTATVGSAVNCGGMLVQGSGNVIVE